MTTTNAALIKRVTLRMTKAQHRNMLYAKAKINQRRIKKGKEPLSTNDFILKGAMILAASLIGNELN